MTNLTRDDLYSLEDYARIRPDFRARVMAHKANRRLLIGENALLLFEDRLTMHYQVQEMLRAERIFEAEGIEDELSAYNPLIPDGANWKATFLIQFEDVEERQRALARLKGIENKVWVRVGNNEHVWAIADEDLDRETDEKTSSVHFLRFELNADMIADLRAGAPMAVGIDHDEYRHTIDAVPGNVRESLIGDLS